MYQTHLHCMTKECLFNWNESHGCVLKRTRGLQRQMLAYSAAYKVTFFQICLSAKHRLTSKLTHYMPYSAQQESYVNKMIISHVTSKIKFTPMLKFYDLHQVMVTQGLFH